MRRLGAGTAGQRGSPDEHRHDAQMGNEETSLYDLVFTLNPLPMYLCDVDTLSVLDVNRAALEFYGYSREEFLAMTLLEFRPPDERDPLLATLEQFKEEGAHRGIWRHTKKDGKVVSVEVNAGLLHAQGRRIGLVVVRHLIYPLHSLTGLDKHDLVRLIAQQNQAISTLEEFIVKLLQQQSYKGPSGHA